MWWPGNPSSMYRGLHAAVLISACREFARSGRRGLQGRRAAIPRSKRVAERHPRRARDRSSPRGSLSSIDERLEQLCRLVAVVSNILELFERVIAPSDEGFGGLGHLGGFAERPGVKCIRHIFEVVAKLRSGLDASALRALAACSATILAGSASPARICGRPGTPT